MTNEKTVRKHSSKILDDLLARITPVSQFQTNTRMTVAARIDDLIVARGWGKSELAQKLSKNPSEVTKWLSGTQNFTLDTLSEIAFIMEIPVSEFFAPVQVQITARLHVSISVTIQAPVIQYLTPAQNEAYELPEDNFSGFRHIMLTPHHSRREYCR